MSVIVGGGNKYQDRCTKLILPQNSSRQKIEDYHRLNYSQFSTARNFLYHVIVVFYDGFENSPSRVPESSPLRRCL